MPSRRRDRSWPPLRRRLFAGFALLAYLTVAVGIPLPVHVDKDRSQPYPCQDHACGCRNAEECWRHCCCFTAEERWAWARQHGITPPAYAKRPAPPKPAVALAWNTPRLRDLAEGKAPPADTCPRCARGEACCPDGACCHTAPRPQAEDPHPAPGGSGWLVGVRALGCHGLGTEWVATGSVLPPPPRLTWTPRLVPEDSLRHAGMVPAIVVVIPPDPPPRSASA